MASQRLKRKAEVLSALVDQIYGELGTLATPSKRFRTDSGTALKSKNDLLKDFSNQHLEPDAKQVPDAHDSPLPISDVVNETPVVLDRDAFLKRLQTYSALFTYGKPITPVECASHGWIDMRDHGLDLEVTKLRCEICSGVVYVTDVKHGISEELLRSIREKYLKGLSELHEKNCIWKYSECDDWIYSFPFFTSYDAIKKWQDQVYTLVTKNESLPPVTSPLTMENMTMLKKLLKLELEFSNDENNMDWLQHKNLNSAIVLPLFGWTYLEVEGRSALKCDLCFRALGLWGFNNNGVSNSNGYTDSTGLVSIDAEKEHRHYCPYINRKQAQITTTGTSRHSSKDSGQVICGWEFMLDMATIECKHLEEMYDLSPKAEQQRSRLRQEAQDLMKAAKTRLAQVLSGSWMKQSISTPDRDLSADHTDDEQHPLSQMQPSPSESDEQTSPSITITYEEKRPLTSAADISDGGTVETEGIAVDHTGDEIKSEDVEPHVNVSEQKVEITQEVANEQKIPTEGTITMAELVNHQPQALAAIKTVARLASPESSLEVNLSTVSSPSVNDAVQELQDDDLEAEESATEQEIYQNAEDEEVDSNDLAASPLIIEEVDAGLTEYIETKSEVSLATPTQVITPEADATFDEENITEGEDHAFNAEIGIEEESAEDITIPVDNVEAAISVKSDAIDEISTDVTQNEDSLDEQVAYTGQPEQNVSHEELQADDHDMDQQEHIEQAEVEGAIEDTVELTGVEESEDQQMEDEIMQESIDTELTARTPKADAVEFEVVDAEDHNIEAAYEADSTNTPSRELDELEDHEVIDVQHAVAEETTMEEGHTVEEVSKEAELLENTQTDQQLDESHLDGDTDLTEDIHPEAKADMNVERTEVTMYEGNNTSAEVETLTVEKDELPISPLPYEEDENVEAALDKDTNGEDDETSNMTPTYIAGEEHDEDVENVQTESDTEVVANFEEESGESEQIEHDFTEYIDEEPQTNEDQTITLTEQDVMNDHTSEGSQPSPAVGVQDNEVNEDGTDASNADVIVETSFNENIPDDQETVESQVNIEEGVQQDILAVDVTEDTEVKVPPTTEVEAMADQSLQDDKVQQQEELFEVNTGDVVEIHSQHEQAQDDIPFAIEDASNPDLSTSGVAGAEDNNESANVLEDSANAIISDKAALQDIGELNEEIAAAETNLMSPGEEHLTESNDEFGNADKEAQEEFAMIEESDAQRPIEEEYEIISADNLGVLDVEDSTDNMQPENAEVSVEVDGNAVVKIPGSPPNAETYQDTVSSAAVPAHNLEDVTHESQIEQQIDNEQLEEYVDNEQLGEYLEEQPAYTPEPEAAELALTPTPHVYVEDHMESPQLMNDNDGDEIQEDDNGVDVFNDADDYEQHSLLELEQNIEGAEDTVKPPSELPDAIISQDDGVPEDTNGIESELHDSILETEADYTKDNSMLDME